VKQFQIQGMASKRTFGLVGDYGDDSSDSEDDQNTVEEAETSNHKENLSQGYLVKKLKHSDNETVPDRIPSNGSKWDGVRTEYDNSSLMYKYTQDMADDEHQKPLTATKQKNELSDAAKAAAEALAHADNLIESGNVNINKTEQSLESQSEFVKHLVADRQRRQQDAEAREQAVIDWEISEIQKEIADERKRWDGVWSDEEEGEGAETEAINKDQKRRNDVIQAVLDEVQKKNKKAEDDDKDKYTKKGERWKRLQMIAQSRVNTDPDKINQYPAHKFPLREQR